LSVFGEQLEGFHLDHAIAAAAQATNSVVRYYHVAPFMSDRHDGRGGHEWFLEWLSEPTSASAFIAAIDGYLRAAVLDYDAHRAGGQLLHPRLTTVPAGSFKRLLEQRGKLGGQHKIPQAWPNRAIADRLSLA
jgi:hypothetical protein